ncbi:MAG: Putative transmembrane protein, partial [uncultured Ramlibacter sp.]
AAATIALHGIAADGPGLLAGRLRRRDRRWWRPDPGPGALRHPPECTPGHAAGHQQERVALGHGDRDGPVHPSRADAVERHAAGRRLRPCRWFRGRLGGDGGLAGFSAQAAAAGAVRRAGVHDRAKATRQAPCSAPGRSHRSRGGQLHRPGPRLLRRILRTGHRQLPGLPVRPLAGLRLPACVGCGQAREHGDQPGRAHPVRVEGARVVALRIRPGCRQHRRQPAGDADGAAPWGRFRARDVHPGRHRADPQDRLRRLPAL